MLTEETIVDKIEVIENGCVQVRAANVIKRDGVEINRSFHRHVLAPGDDLTGQDARVAAIANATWTNEVVAAYQASLNNEAV
jgi:hypothetical protein